MAEKKSDKPAVPKKPVAAKVFDVKRPEETLASATSKPVIVGHTNIIKDPMVSPAELPVSDLTDPETPAEKPKHELMIEPLSDSTLNEEVAETETEDVSITEETAQEPEPTAESDAEDQTNQSSDTSSAAVDAIVDTINTKKERSEDAEKQQVIDNEINSLIDSRQFNVKIRPTPNKRKIRLFVVFFVILILTGVGWYFGVGPGKDLWLNDTAKTSNNPTATIQNSGGTKNDEITAPQLLAFTNATIKTTFSYPKTWKVDVAKDLDHPTVDVITLTSPAEQIDSAVANEAPTKAEVFMRAKIFVENTKNTKEYASDLASLTTCVSEDIIIANTNLKLLFSDESNQSPNVSLLSLSPEVCTLSGKIFKANDQVQFPTKQNTYVVYTEYVLSTAFLEKNGIKEASAVKQAQDSGITTTKDAFKASMSYKEFLEIIKSIKEL